MFGLPASTEFGRRIPKQKFYDNTTITPALKRLFVEQIHLMYWRNKLAATTLNLTAGRNVTEIEVLEIRLHTSQLDESILRQIDREIPYHILFILTYEGKAQAWIGYKEMAASGQRACKVGRYYHTDWMPEENLQFHIDGLDLDAVYESLVRQIAGDSLQVDSGERLKDTVARDEQRRQLEKQIAALERKMHKEKQLNRRMEIHEQVKQVQMKLENIKND